MKLVNPYLYIAAQPHSRTAAQPKQWADRQKISKRIVFSRAIGQPSAGSTLFFSQTKPSDFARGAYCYPNAFANASGGAYCQQNGRPNSSGGAFAPPNGTPNRSGGAYCQQNGLPNSSGGAFAPPNGTPTVRFTHFSA
jgi:hypothetical protein